MSIAASTGVPLHVMLKRKLVNIPSLFVSGADNTIHVWDDTPEILYTIPLEDPLLFEKVIIRAGIQLHDGRLAIVSSVGVIFVLNSITLRIEFTVRDHIESIYSIVQLPNGTLVTGGARLRFWDISSRECIHKESQGKYVNELLVLRDGRLVVSHFGRESILIFDVSSGTLNHETKKVLSGHTYYARCVAQLNNSTLISASDYTDIIIWDLTMYNIKTRVSIGSQSPVCCIVPLRDNSILVCGEYLLTLDRDGGIVTNSQVPVSSTACETDQHIVLGQDCHVSIYNKCSGAPVLSLKLYKVSPKIIMNIR
jgi:WD40 repeat protein